MKTNFDSYNYIISIDLGTTFSGSCYACTNDKDTIVHVTKWPEQQDSFEKTPTVCLYDITKSPPEMIKWGKAAMDHATLFPNDENTLLISEFKLKLFHQQPAELDNLLVSYRTAAIDYLHAIHTYTILQFLQNNPEANVDQVRYVLTIPAAWVQEDSEALRAIAIEAGLVSAAEDEIVQKTRISVLSEAHAASLFCEREYCNTSATRFFEGQRYLVCDAGGGTVDLAVFEQTTNDQGHCQLALESGGTCGSTILDQNMEIYLRDKMFFGCADERIIKLLVDQFKKEIKHHFGEDSNEHSNYIPPIAKVVKKDTGRSTIVTVEETKVPTNMVDFKQDDYDYDMEYESDDFMEDIPEDYSDPFENEESEEDDQDDTSNFYRDHDGENNTGMKGEYIYLTLPSEFKNLIEPLIIENLLLRQDLTSSNQIRISHSEVCKNVFDPVVSKVISLIRKQINKSYTTIGTLFLLGGFGQSPYLHKKLHEEFITVTNSVNRLIVPEEGYRASMRGGVHYGLDCAKAIPEFFLKDRCGNILTNALPYSKYDTLVTIDFNFHELTAVYSVVELDGNGRLTQRNLNTLIEERLSSETSAYKNFSFDPSRFIDEYYRFFEDVLSLNRLVLLSNDDDIVSQWRIRDRLYFDFIIDGFIQQLFQQIQIDEDIYLPNIRYCASVSSTASLEQASTMFDIPKERLKQHLLSKMMQSTRLPNALKCDLHDAVCGILDEYSIIYGRIMPKLKKKVQDIAILLGMLEDGDSEARFAWNSNSRNSFYIRKYASNNFHNYESSKVFVFDLSYESSDYPARARLGTRSSRIAAIPLSRGKVQVCNMARGSMILRDEETFFENLDFVSSLAQKPETDFINPAEILELVTARNFNVDQLLTFLGTETDFMASEHVRNYIKHNVDLSEPYEQHSVRDFFLMPNTENVVAMNYQKKSELMKKTVEHVIRLFKHKTFTTRNVEGLLLIPWIKRILIPAVLNIYANNHEQFLSRLPSSNVKNRVSYLIFTDQIIETKHQGQKQKTPGSNRQTCAAFLFDMLYQEIEFLRLSSFGSSDIEVHNEVANMGLCRRIGSIVDGAGMPRKKEMTRIARKTYAVHFLKYLVKKSTKIIVDELEVKDQQETSEGNDQDKKENKDKKSSETSTTVQIDIDLQDHLTLHPLIRQDADLTLECNKLNYNQYCIGDQCSVAAVLYASDEMPHLGDHYISNTSFKKLHRFIIPVDDPTKPICIRCKPEDYSIIFRISQGDDYKADFRCNDLMYYC